MTANVPPGGLRNDLIATDAEDVNVSSTDWTPTLALYWKELEVTSAGTVSIVTAGGHTETFNGRTWNVGERIPVAGKQVNKSGTTAGLTAMY